MNRASRPDPAFWRGRRVLLTGHTGFKGSWLLLWLQELGAEVWGYALHPDPEPNLFRQLAAARPPGQAGQGVWHHRQGDLGNQAALAALINDCQPEVVLHLAAQSLVRRGYRDPLGTWQTNVIGTLHLLEALRQHAEGCAVVCVTTDKVYENQGLDKPFQEADRLGGSDPYSGSKAAMELAVTSWRTSFCGTAPHQRPGLWLATARAGNVIGGGDWAEDRLLPDAVRALREGRPIVVRQPTAIRPWQHVLEPLAGYLLLAERLHRGDLNAHSFNFGPSPADSRSVADVVRTLLRHWPGDWRESIDPQAPVESGQLRLNSDRAHRTLGWWPAWSFEQTLARTIRWYRAVHDGDSPLLRCLADLEAFAQSTGADSARELRGHSLGWHGDAPLPSDSA